MRRDEDDAIAQVFRTLADPTRRQLLDRLHQNDGQTLGALCRDLATSRQGITQHLAMLEAAGLVATVRRGREKLHHLNRVPLHEIYERWIAKFQQPDLEALSSMKRLLEQDGHAMDKPKLVHVTYIATTPDQLWNALTDPELTARYWGHRNVSGWAKGDSWEHRRLDDEGADVVGTILEVDPPRRLSHTWASPDDANETARHSRVTFDLEPVGEAVRLTVTHEDLPADQVEGTREGWNMVVSSLKSLLETGHPLGSLA
ncbi:MAG: hypothetical protein V7603_2130 [Micromonosporaceae bacterium]|jgi:uncharacterized protein YndB with AHSA1/START domain/DNA-binding transcriptional ArsR family regulator